MHHLIMIGFILLTSCSSINDKFGLPDDNLGEELIEDMIKGRTGQDIDLSPFTQERNNE